MSQVMEVEVPYPCFSQCRLKASLNVQIAIACYMVI